MHFAMVDKADRNVTTVRLGVPAQFKLRISAFASLENLMDHACQEHGSTVNDRRNKLS